MSFKIKELCEICGNQLDNIVRKIPKKFRLCCRCQDTIRILLGLKITPNRWCCFISIIHFYDNYFFYQDKFDWYIKNILKCSWYLENMSPDLPKVSLGDGNDV